MWTEFWDMHSGGGQKEKFSQCFIEASYDEAKSVFYSRFGHNPERITCTCCGEDYSISEYKTLEEATKYHRGDDGYNKTKKVMSLEDFIKQDNIMVIYAKDITAEELKTDVPEQGYVWVD